MQSPVANTARRERQREIEKRAREDGGNGKKRGKQMKKRGNSQRWMSLEGRGGGEGWGVGIEIGRISTRPNGTQGHCSH